MNSYSQLRKGVATGIELHIFDFKKTGVHDVFRNFSELFLCLTEISKYSK